MSAPSPSPHESRKAEGRKHPALFGFLVAWLEKRFVSSEAVDLVRPSLQNQWLQPEIAEKLATLDMALPLHRDLRRRVELALDLYESVESGAYRKPEDWAELEPCLGRALAYFVSNNDAIPDRFEDGFEDDHREFMALGERLGGLLDVFEYWRRGWTRRGDAAAE